MDLAAVAAAAMLSGGTSTCGYQRAGAASARMLDLSDPRLDFVHLATGLGVNASRATTAEELADQLTTAYTEPGPHLIEAIVPPIL